MGDRESGRADSVTPPLGNPHLLSKKDRSFYPPDAKASLDGFRDVAQSGSAPQWGCGGRWFESSRPDHLEQKRALTRLGSDQRSWFACHGAAAYANPQSSANAGRRQSAGEPTIGRPSIQSSEAPSPDHLEQKRAPTRPRSDQRSWFACHGAAAYASHGSLAEMGRKVPTGVPVSCRFENVDSLPLSHQDDKT